MEPQDWAADPYFTVHESPSISFDIQGNVIDWSMINIEKLVRVIRESRFNPRGTIAKKYESFCRETGSLAGDVMCLRPLQTGQLGAEWSLTVGQFERRNTAEEIGLRPFWCDRETAQHFFFANDLHHSAKLPGIYLFAMPADIIAEIGTLDTETGYFTLAKNVRMVPVVANM